MKKTIKDVWQFTSYCLTDEEYHVDFGERPNGIERYNYKWMTICGQALADHAKQKIKVWVGGKSYAIFEPKTGTVFGAIKSDGEFFDEVLDLIMFYVVKQRFDLKRKRSTLIYPAA